ncbi:hypothetical protein PMALA_051930 [Plasmodium malariae]|uniref:Uncharacterized protein n=1 Tax=Plasmodium malariae TaxID=5858 RepID=A0A1A8WTG3_PLAMA|nr:hypothetical protein PMALA_051930 [Plasmodium malariae]
MDLRTYRLLEKCKQGDVSNIVVLKHVIPNGELEDKTDISNNEKGDKRKYKQLNRSSFSNVEQNKHSKKNKSYIFETKKYSHLEKKIFKELDYLDFIKNNNTISDKVYKKFLLWLWSQKGSFCIIENIIKYNRDECFIHIFKGTFRLFFQI